MAKKPSEGLLSMKMGRMSPHTMARMRWMMIAVLVLAPMTGWAAGRYPEKMGKINMDAYINLPAPGSLVAVKSGNELLLMSGNGRYIIRGAVYDMWNGGKRIHNLAEARASSRHIRFSELGLDLSDLASITLGDKGGKPVTVFIDPDSQRSMELLQQLSGLKGYKFTVVVLAAMNKKSASKGKGLMCLFDKDPEKAREALLSGSLDFVPSGECGKERLLKTLMTASLFGIDRVPFIIAPNGEFVAGIPSDLNQFLEENSQ